MIKRAIALGFFDGVHIGHGALLRRVRERSDEIGATPSVLSFDVHPDTLVFGKEVKLLNSALSREEIIRRLYGIDNVVFIHFNQHTMRMPWQQFADALIEELSVAWVVVGHDFCFGYRGEGTAEKLKAYCAERGVGCDVIPPVLLDGRVVSSTYIRTLPQRIVPELTRDPAAVQLRCDPFGAETLFGVMPRYGNRIARIVEVCMVTQPFDGSVCGSRGCSFPQELVPQFLFGMRPVREKTQRTFPRKGGGGLLL